MRPWQCRPQGKVEKHPFTSRCLPEGQRKYHSLLLITRSPPTALFPNARYERIMEAFGCQGYYVETKAELRDALTKAFHETRNRKKPVLINIMVDTTAGRKPQVHYES